MFLRNINDEINIQRRRKLHKKYCQSVTLGNKIKVTWKLTQSSIKYAIVFKKCHQEVTVPVQMISTTSQIRSWNLKFGLNLTAGGSTKSAHRCFF